MTIHLLLFGACREAASGLGELVLEMSAPATVASVWTEMSRRYPALSRFERQVLFAVNEEYARLETPLVHGDTLAIFPPVSGG